MSMRADFFKIDESLFNVCVDQLHPDWFTNVQTFKPFHKLAFNRDREKPDPCSFFGSTGYDRIEPLPDP